MNNNNRSSVFVTSLLACKGLLWVGTNVGRVLTIPLPRLEGVPIISGRVNISYHAHFGPISFLLALQPKNHSTGLPKLISRDSKEEIKESESLSLDNSFVEKTEESPRPKMEKQLSDSSVQSSVSAKLKYLTNSPVVLRKRKSKENDLASRMSKTLPRGKSSFAENSTNIFFVIYIFGR